MRIEDPPTPAELVPASLSGAFGLVVLVAGLWWTRGLPWTPVQKGLAAAGAAAAIMALHDWIALRIHTRPSAGLDRPVHIRKLDLGRVGVKLLGFAATVGAIAACYAVFPEYRGRFYNPYWEALRLVAWPICGLAPFYFAWVDARMRAPHDGYWQVGALLLGKRSAIDRDILRKHALGWLVKGFFLPLMVVYFSHNIASIATRSFDPQTFRGVFNLAWLGLYTIDVAFAVIGYSLTVRVLDSHIRSAEPTLFGWAICIMCYQPFWALAERMYLHYEDRTSWASWLGGIPVLYQAWGIAILLCTVVYVWATVTFGVRFSNLTHRGILSFGPYRWLRHPAYVSKNLSWWLLAVPFISVAGPAEALRACVALALLNGVYALRAWTEERHLSRQDPAYDAYRARCPGLISRLL